MSWSYTMTAYLLITALWKTCLSLCSEEIVYFLDIVWIHYCSIIGELKYWRSIPFLPCTLPPKRNIANNSQLNVNLNSAGFTSVFMQRKERMVFLWTSVLQEIIPFQLLPGMLHLLMHMGCYQLQHKLY